MNLKIQRYGLEGSALEASFGPFPATSGEIISLGRDSTNRVVLPERSVSRQHAELIFENGIWRLRDLSSRYGTFLNGETLMGEATVTAGDRVRLGRLHLVLVEADSPVDIEPPAKEPSSLDVTIRANAASLAIAGPPQVPASGGKSASLPPTQERRYRLLLAILEILAADRSIPEIMASVIRLAGTAVMADRGFILLSDPDTGRWLPSTVVSWHAELADTDSGVALTPKGGEILTDATIVEVSQTVLREALDTGNTVFLKYAATDPRYLSAESIHIQEVQSLICCPLSVDEKRVGAFYVDRKHQGSHPFSEEDKELLLTVAHQAARVLEKEQLLNERARGEKLAMLGTMVARVTHELKNPLYNIRGTTENLLEKLATEELPADQMRARLERILAGLEKAESRMRGLLRFARPAAGSKERVDLARVLTAAAVECSGLLREQNVSLVRNYSKGLFVLADAEALEQVFSNLLVNAAQALLERGGGEVTLDAILERRLSPGLPDWVTVRVMDDGPGVAPENMKRIFEDFFTTKLERGGSGLGLAICRHLVEEQRGRLEVDNRPEGGACFRVGLPIQELGPEARARLGDANIRETDSGEMTT